MSIFKKWVRINGVDISELSEYLGKIYVTNINAGQLIEKKKTYVEVPFQNGKIDVSNAFGDEHYYNDIPMEITIEIVGRMSAERTRSNSMEIFRKIRNYISDLPGKIKVETSDEIGVVYSSTHISVSSEKGPSPEHLIVIFNFESNPVKTKRIGGKGDFIECLNFDTMQIGDCWNSAFFISQSVPGTIYFFRVDEEVDVVYIDSSKQTTIKINGKNQLLNKGINKLNSSLFQKGNEIVTTEQVTLEIYYEFYFV